MQKTFTPPNTFSCIQNKTCKELCRINWIDWAKAIGIYLVVTGHSHHNNADVGPLIFMIHMPLFFVVSGYLFKTGKSLKEITLSNLRGLIIPYILYNIIASLYWLLIGGVKSVLGQQYDWDSCVITPAMNTLFGYSLGSFNGPTWFLLALVWCKYFCWLVHRGRKPVLICTLLVWVIMFYIRNQTSDLFYYSFDCGLAGFIWFEIGYIYKRYVKMRNFSIPTLLTFTVVGFVLCYCVYSQVGMCNYILSKTNGIWGVVGTGAGLIAFFSLCYMLNDISLNIVTMVSKASIVIMCLHMPVQSLIEAFVHYQGPELLTFSVDFIILMILTALFPLIKRHVPVLLGGR